MKINFCSLPFLDSGYENTIDFENLQSQINFFKSKTLFSLDVNVKPDSLRDSVTIKGELGKFNGVDYIWINSSEENNRINYYFVVGKEYVTRGNTTLYLQLDVFQTYLFNYNILESFVDRCHVPRWVDGFPTLHTIDEGLDMGEIQQLGEPVKICGFNDSIVITSTVPLGKLPNVGGSIGGSGDCWENGQLSPQGFRFIKGFEGFAPNQYQDSGGYWTIAYGVTKHGEPDIYSELVSMQPVPEEKGAMISYDLKTKRYGIPILDTVKAMGITRQCQFDALLSVAYNCGVGAITGSNSLTNAIAQNPNDESVIRPIWENFKVTSNGIPLNGLKARRKQECNLYFGLETEIRPIGLINTSGYVSGTVIDNNGNGWLPNG